jgi:hypothetical protein
MTVTRIGRAVCRAYTILSHERRCVDFAQRPRTTHAPSASSKRLTINGKAANVQPLGAYTGNPGADLVREAIGDRSHLQLLMRGRLSAGGTYTVPDGHFVLGDHRDNSRDSRLSGFEFIPVESIVGKVALVWWNTDDSKRAGIVPE